jgi:DNA modification methylase
MNLAFEAYHPTNTTTHKHAVDRWYNFIAGFSPEFVSACLSDYTGAEKTVLDPFTGCGTVQVQANKMGWNSVGYEPHPIFFRIAQAKSLASDHAQHLSSIVSTLRKGLGCPQNVDILKPKQSEFLLKLFDPSILSMLLGARQELKNSEYKDNDLAFLILSKVVDLSSKSQTDGIYKAPTSSKRATDPFAALDKVISMIEEDISRSESPNVKIHHAPSYDMSEVQDGTVSVIVTSPPYLNNFDFAEMTRMHLYFWDLAESWGEITSTVRSRLLVNTTTALKGHKERQIYYRSTLPEDVLEEVDQIVEALKEQRLVRAGKKEYDYLVYPYFSQMKEVLNSCHRTLKSGGRFHMMVADAALYGVHISSPQILAQIMESVGFKNVICQFVRQRGHRWVLSKRDGSKKGLGEYHVYGERVDA